MKISVSTGLYYKEKNYKEILDIISSTSCNNIELFLNEKFSDVPILELEKELLKRNLNVKSIHTPLEYIAFKRRESESYWINNCIEIAKIFDAKVIVSHMINSKFFYDNTANLDEIHKNNLINFQKNKGVYVTTENCPYALEGSFLQRFDELFKFISENNINLTFDTTHCACGGFPLIETFKKFRNFVRNIHLSDFHDGAEHKVLGTGSLPIKDFIIELKKDNYEGLLTLELDFDNKQRNNIENDEQAILAIENSLKIIKNSIESI